jgi:hypothetical protein
MQHKILLNMDFCFGYTKINISSGNHVIKLLLINNIFLKKYLINIIVELFKKLFI